jgi:hypothetical protein
MYTVAGRAASCRYHVRRETKTVAVAADMPIRLARPKIRALFAIREIKLVPSALMWAVIVWAGTIGSCLRKEYSVALEAVPPLSLLRTYGAALLIAVREGEVVAEGQVPSVRLDMRIVGPRDEIRKVPVIIGRVGVLDIAEIDVRPGPEKYAHPLVDSVDAPSGCILQRLRVLIGGAGEGSDVFGA